MKLSNFFQNNGFDSEVLWKLKCFFCLADRPSKIDAYLMFFLKVVSISNSEELLEGY